MDMKTTLSRAAPPMPADEHIQVKKRQMSVVAGRYFAVNRGGKPAAAAALVAFFEALCRAGRW